MKRHWPVIAVADVPKSAASYLRLLQAQQSHPGGKVFDQIVDTDGTVMLCLHHWGPSGPRGDHLWPTLAKPSESIGNGIFLWFVVDDLDAAWKRAQSIGSPVVERPSTDNGTGMRAFVIQDPDGYQVAVNETMPENGPDIVWTPHKGNQEAVVATKARPTIWGPIGPGCLSQALPQSPWPRKGRAFKGWAVGTAWSLRSLANRWELG